jgi:SAM-dependent methyltransferase
VTNTPVQVPTQVLTHAPERDDVEAYYRTIAPFYDAEQANRHDLDFWRSIAEEHRGGRVLELGAGSGQVTAALAPAARELVAVDVSPELLRLARLRLADWPNVHLLLADMRELDFSEPFDLIVAANDPLSHLVETDDRDRALRVVARHLAPGGRFVLDALWLSPGEAAAVARPGGRVRQHTTSLDGQRMRVVERWQRARGRARCCQAHYEYRRASGPPVVAEFEAHDWSTAELADRFERAGLVVAETWGSYQRAPWDPRTSSQLVVAAGPA